MNPTESQVEDLKNEVDEDQNGVIDMNEFVTMVQEQFSSMDNDEDLLLQSFSQIDTSGRGSISLDEIRTAIEQCKFLAPEQKDFDQLKAITSRRYNTKRVLTQDVAPSESKFQKFKRWSKQTIKRYRNPGESQEQQNALDHEVN